VEPGGDPGGPLEAFQRPEGGHERLLHGVAGVLFVAHQPPRYRQHTASMLPQQPLESRLVAGAQLREKEDFLRWQGFHRDRYISKTVMPSLGCRRGQGGFSPYAASSFTPAMNSRSVFLASPSTIIVFGWMNSSFSMPAKPVFMLRFSTMAARASSTLKTGMP
jgi:hypothetical protein